MTTYFRVRLQNVPAHLEDIVTTHAFSHGASGVSEALAYVQPNLVYDPRILPVKSHEIDVFFPENPKREFFEGLEKIHPESRWQIFEEEIKDWLAEWKKGFKAFQLVGPYWVVPSWEEIPAECTVPLRIDPGMAFGTGTHATTQMMAFFIHKLAQSRKALLGQQSLLDVGTGTAILAMMAERAGFKRVLGLEIDPEARRTARQNVELNGLKLEIPETQIDELRETFDIVAANIIDGVLVALKKDLLRCTKPGGQLLLTGILAEHDDSFFKDFIEDAPLKVVRRLEKDEWVGYWLERLA